MSSRFVIASSSPLKGAVTHILSVLKVPQANVASGDLFQVCIPSGEHYTGMLPMLSVLRSEIACEDAQTFLSGSSPTDKLLVNQWVSLASQIAVNAAQPEEAEAALGGATEFLIGSQRATVADVLMYAALTDEAVARLPQLLKWSRQVVADAYVSPIARSATAAPLADAKVATSSGATSSGTAPASAFVKPSAEEIERRRIEKEKAKAEKEKNKGAEGQPAAAPAAAPVAAAAKKGTNAAMESTELDVRVGKILTIGRHPEADKLYVETIDLGGGEVRTIVSGLVEHYSVDELAGALVLVVCNLKPKPLKGVASHGMVLCASSEQQGLKLVAPPQGTAPGQRVSFGGKLSEKVPDVPSNAGTIELLSHLKTNEHGVVVWKDQVATVPSGPITSTLVNAIVK